MARRTPQTFLKRQREQNRAEKARQKLAKREARKQDDVAPENAPASDLNDEAETAETDESNDSSGDPKTPRSGEKIGDEVGSRTD